MNGRLVLLIAALAAFAHVWNANERMSGNPPLLATRHTVVHQALKGNPVIPVKAARPAPTAGLPAGIYRVVDSSGYVGVVAIPGQPTRSLTPKDLYEVREQGTTRYYIRQQSPQTARQNGIYPLTPR